MTESKVWFKKAMVSLLLAGLIQWSGVVWAKPESRPVTPPIKAPYSFMVIGDFPYRQSDVPTAQVMMQAINHAKPAFTVHVGDIAHPGDPAPDKLTCSDATFSQMLRLLGLLKAPWVYTPGDNEWTDCARDADDPYEPLERLAQLRNQFFPSVESYPFTVAAQSPEYPENRRWQVGNVVYATVHVVGSHNNLIYGRPEDFAEYHARNAANMAWTAEAFTTAKAVNAGAVVLFFHADPHFEGTWDERLGFQHWVDELAQQSAAFGKPVLLVHGDSHHFRMDQPFLASKGYPSAPQVCRLIGHGDPTIAATQVTVTETSEHGVQFAVQGLYPNGAPSPVSVVTSR